MYLTRAKKRDLSSGELCGATPSRGWRFGCGVPPTLFVTVQHVYRFNAKVVGSCCEAAIILD